MARPDGRQRLTSFRDRVRAVWAGDRLVVWGGYRWNRSFGEAEMLNAGWSWIPSE